MKDSASYNVNRFRTQTGCAHCGGVARHERWCITRDATVFYAYDVVVHPEKLSTADALILHSLGVRWN